MSPIRCKGQTPICGMLCCREALMRSQDVINKGEWRSEGNAAGYHEHDPPLDLQRVSALGGLQFLGLVASSPGGRWNSGWSPHCWLYWWYEYVSGWHDDAMDGCGTVGGWQDKFTFLMRSLRFQLCLQLRFIVIIRFWHVWVWSVIDWLICVDDVAAAAAFFL